MARVLSLPFKLSAAGHAVTVEQGSEEYYKQQVATILTTIMGERGIFDELGMPDIAFTSFPYSALQSQLDRYLPAVTDVSVVSEFTSDSTQSVTIQFDLTQE